MRILTGALAFDDEIHWIGTGFDSPGFTDSSDQVGNTLLIIYCSSNDHK